MSQASRDYETMCRIGYGCGLNSIDGCYDQMRRHYDAFFLIEDAPKRLSNLEAYITSLGTWEKTIEEACGVLWCRERDLEEVAMREDNRYD